MLGTVEAWSGRPGEFFFFFAAAFPRRLPSPFFFLQQHAGRGRVSQISLAESASHKSARCRCGAVRDSAASMGCPAAMEGYPNDLAHHGVGGPAG